MCVLISERELWPVGSILLPYNNKSTPFSCGAQDQTEGFAHTQLKSTINKIFYHAML